jgi:hypothetical protein
MNAIVQFDLFEEKPSELELLRKDIAAVGESATKVRKGTYAAIGELKTRVLSLEERLELLERNICKGNK